MEPDPIVEEVRNAGAKLAEEAGYDLHRFFENLRRAQQHYGKPLVGKPVPRSGDIVGRARSRDDS